VEEPHVNVSPPGGLAAPPDSNSAARRKDRVVGLTIVAVAFVISLFISLWAKKKSEPEQAPPLAPPTTERIEGWPSSVDPVKNLPRAREATRRLLLRCFVAEGVRSDGAVDLSGASNNIRYSFQSPQGHGPQPPREPGIVPRRDLCGRQSVRIRNTGLYADPDQPEVACSSAHGEPLPDPGCSLAEVWKKAIDRNVSPQALARIEYYRARSGPAFRFALLDDSNRFSLSADCEHELSGRDASGHVP
jgi:hypothetical protein